MKLWPFRTEKKALTDDEILEMLGGGAPTSSGIAVSSDTALRVPAVAGAVRIISEAAACLNVKVVEIAADRTETEVVDHPVVALLRDEANDWTSGFELIRSLVVDALCRDAGGLAWVNWLNGQPTEIINYRSGYIQVDATQDSREPAFRIQGRLVPSQQIIRVRGPFEKCPVTLSREAIGVALVMEKYAGKLFANGARPSGQIVTPKPLGDEGVKKMVKGFLAAHGGADKAGGTPIFWDGTEFKALQMSSVDAQFQQLRAFQLIEIVARAFGVPPSMVGDLTRATWSNASEMQRQFLLLCLEPWLQALESGLRRALFLKDERKRFAIRFDRDDFTNVDLTARATAASTLISSRAMSPNEARTILLDMPKGPPELDQYANPNTGASQPGMGQNGGPKLDDPNVGNSANQNDNPEETA